MAENRARDAFIFFVSCKWTKEQAAGIVGNLQAECGQNLAFERAVGDAGTAFGLAQWRNERLDKFEEVFGFPLVQGSFEDQLNYVDWELRNTEKKAGKRLAKATEAGKAAEIVDQYYERSSGEHRSIRIANAEKILRLYGKDAE